MLQNEKLNRSDFNIMLTEYIASNPWLDKSLFTSPEFCARYYDYYWDLYQKAEYIQKVYEHSYDYDIRDIEKKVLKEQAKFEQTHPLDEPFRVSRPSSSKKCVSKVYCMNCGTSMPLEARYCSCCGTKIVAPENINYR
jgi:hypothetical protein